MTFVNSIRWTIDFESVCPHFYAVVQLLGGDLDFDVQRDYLSGVGYDDSAYDESDEGRRY